MDVTLWMVACQAPPSMGFPWQEYWSGLPLPHAGDPPDPGIESVSPAVVSKAFFTTAPPQKPIRGLWEPTKLCFAYQSLTTLRANSMPSAFLICQKGSCLELNTQFLSLFKLKTF